MDMATGMSPLQVLLPRRLLLQVMPDAASTSWHGGHALIDQDMDSAARRAR